MRARRNRLGSNRANKIPTASDMGSPISSIASLSAETRFGTSRPR
jgi:hypothetical protein